MRRCKPNPFQRAFFSSLRSWASPYEVFLRNLDRTSVSRSTFRSCAFFQNLISLESALQRFNPKISAVPLCASRRISSGQGLYFLGLLTFKAFPLLARLNGHFPHSVPLVRLDVRNLTTSNKHPFQGFANSRSSAFPFCKGAGLLGLFDRQHSSLFNARVPRTIFSSPSAQPFYKGRTACLCGPRTVS